MEPVHMRQAFDAGIPADRNTRNSKQLYDVCYILMHGVHKDEVGVKKILGSGSDRR
jgi:hypothetical protein